MLQEWLVNTMGIKIIVLTIFILGSVIAVGQTKYTDVVYLQNGEIIKGEVIEQDLKTSVTLVTRESDTLYIRMEDIKKLTREIKVNEKSLPVNNRFSPGFKVIAEAGWAFGTGEFGMNFFKADVTGGIQANSFLFLGLGMGVKYFPDPHDHWVDDTHLLVPVFIDIRFVYPVFRQFSGFISLDAGFDYNKDRQHSYFMLMDKYLNGLFYNPSIGISVKLPGKHSLSIEAGYEIQKMPFWDEFNPGRNANGYHTDVNYSNSFGIMAAFMF